MNKPAELSETRQLYYEVVSQRNKLAAENSYLTNQIEYLEEKFEEYYNRNDQEIEKELTKLRAANAELVEALREICTHFPDGYVVRINEIAIEVLAKHGGKNG